MLGVINNRTMQLPVYFSIHWTWKLNKQEEFMNYVKKTRIYGMILMGIFLGRKRHNLSSDDDEYQGCVCGLGPVTSLSNLSIKRSKENQFN